MQPLLRLQGDIRRETVATLLATAQQRQDEAAFAEVLRLAGFYPEDMGLFAPLLLNVITLQPGEAICSCMRVRRMLICKGSD